MSHCTRLDCIGGTFNACKIIEKKPRCDIDVDILFPLIRQVNRVEISKEERSRQREPSTPNSYSSYGPDVYRKNRRMFLG